MRRTNQIRRSIALVVIGAWPLLAGPAMAQERLLRCVTSSNVAGPGHHPQRFAQRHLYAPARNAMFFSRGESPCRWQAARHPRG